MPRPERPVDPADGVVPEFAFALRKLREQAGGPTYRQLAELSGYSVTTLSHAAGGRQLPSLEVALAYVDACGGDRAEWSARWHAAALAVADARLERRAPYRGLVSFRVEDADLFFGRERLVEEVVALVREHRFAVVVGASGAGKTSLLAAGVVPALGGPVAWIAPGERLTEAPVIVVDQFEQLFTLFDADRRTAFIDRLFTVTDRCAVVIGVRADFYGRCTEHRRLAEALRDRQVLVGPMSDEELHDAVSRPAAAVGLSVERALLATIVHDTAGRAGALPLVSHALLETWRRRRGEVLTLVGYQSTGGVRGALVRTAEAAYGELPADQQRLAAELLLRMIAVDENTATCRRVDLAELLDTDPDAGAVLDTLADARLITIDDGGVEISHEALLEHWPRLRDWLAEDRDGLRVHHQLTEAAHTWQALDRDPGTLYHGTRLAVATGWVERTGSRVHLTGAEREFLAASATAERRRTALRRRLTAALAVFSVLALAATVVAGLQARRAGQANEQARSRQLAAEARVLAPTDVEAAMRAAVDAYHTAPTEEARSVVLSLAGTQSFHGRLTGHTGEINALAITPDGRTAVSGGADGNAVVWHVPRRKALHTLENGRQVRDLAISRDGTRVAVAGRDGMLSVWRLADGKRVARLSGHRGSVESVTFGPDGTTLVSVDSTRTAIVWKDNRPRATVTGHGGMDSAVAAGPGQTAAIAGDDGTVTIVDLGTGQVRERLPAGIAPLYAVAVHPSDGSIVAGGDADTLVRWDRDRRREYLDANTNGQIHDLTFQADGRRLHCACGRQTMTWNPASSTPESSLGVRTGAVHAVGASADGGLVAATGADGATLLWDRARLPLRQHTGGVRGLAVSPDGDTLASAGADGTVGVWSTRDRTLRAVLTAHRAPVNAVDIAPDGSIASASNDHTVAVSRPSGSDLRFEHNDRVRDVAFHPDGRSLAYGGADGRVLRREFDGPPREVHRQRGPVHTLAFSPDGRYLASAGQDEQVLLTDLDANRTTRLAGPAGRIDALAFAPDGTRLAAGGTTGAVLVWNLDTAGKPWRLPGNAQPVTTLAFSPDDRFLATGDQNTVVLWDIDHRTRWTTLTGHTDKVTSAAWSPDSTVLYTGSTDRTIIPWTTDPDAAHTNLRRQLAYDFR